MKVVHRSKLQGLLSCFLATNQQSNEKSITTHKIHHKLTFSLPLRRLLCFRDWSTTKEAAMERKELLRCSLQDLFVSSSPEVPLPLQCGTKDLLLDSQIEMSRGTESTGQNNGSGLYHRFRFANLRHRLLRRSWRPALVAIPE